ncbi:venom serine carboxypeptidase-like [Macrosteles quadrilineatus]|uniref:venom serine carboxypeptidase-like n=1 Tax=Macrosteles quadrilineatus TaxID=74068 RepID=UPI0023E12F7D|nr:venom serine carboxypeptidase-like [Macrosteles quadrilineatus]
MFSFSSFFIGLYFLCIANCCSGLFHIYPKINDYPIQGGFGDDPGLPLILTPLIKAKKIQEARVACKMTPMKSNISSYAGFFTVDPAYNSNMFFWFFPAYQNNASAPVILWLQGGPGATSLYGLFAEHGPFSVKRKHGLKLREYTWTHDHNVIYIDNPVGTGFSFTNADGYVKNEAEVGKHLYSALYQFFTLFPEYQKNDFFVTGESYAGKYVPSTAYAIHNLNKQAEIKINLKGVAIGNGLCDPEHMMQYGNYLYQIGLLDSNGRNLFLKKEQEIVKSIQQKNWKSAFNQFDALLNGDLTNGTSIFKTLTGFSFYFNYLYNQDYSTYGDMGRFLSNVNIRKNLHVGNATFHVEAVDVEKNLIEDIMQSVKPTIEFLLNANYRVLIYNGQLDIIVAFPLTENFVDALNWNGAQDYKVAQRKQWFVGKELAGYSRVARNLNVVLVRNAGHMVPMDQPKWSVDLISRFTRGKPFSVS